MSEDGDADAHRSTAVEALADRSYETAGDEYTRAAWATLAAPRPGLGPFDGDEKGWVGGGLERFAAAALAYRVADRTDRASRRAAEGIAVARDLKTGLDHPAQRACLDEFVGDFRVVGGMGGVDDAYATATDAYEAAGESIDDPRKWGTTPLFEAATAGIKQAARSSANGEIAVEWGDLHGSDPARPGPFLAARPRYKRRRFATLVERCVDDGYLAAPRGTTEYGNDTYRCPNCGADDVNWVAETILCMRCSTPMEG